MAMRRANAVTRPTGPHGAVGHFTLRTLGGLALLRPDGGEEPSLSRKRRKLAMLAWLAMRRAPATRDQVIGLFWGGRAEDRARNSLSDALSHVRRVLGRDMLPGFDETIVLAGEARLAVDALVLADAAAAGDHARVIALYQGDFLEGVYVDDAPEFEHWRDRERQRLAALFVKSGIAHCDTLARARQWERCRVLAERLLDEDPANGDAALFLLNAIKAPGTHAARVAALRAFQSLTDRLRRELDVGPERAVGDLAREIAVMVDSEGSDTRPAPPSAPTSPERVLVGRDEEWRALDHALSSAVRGRGGVVCVTGEPGMGKTTLVEAWLECAVHTAHAPAVAHGRCSERLAGAEAYLPLLDALDDLLAGARGADAGALLRRVAPLWHAWRSPASSGSRSVTPEPAATQERLKRELVAFFRELSRAGPLVLFLDDLHWSDASTIDFLAYLATHLDRLRLLVVVTFRAEELREARHPFLALQRELESHGAARELALSFFTPEEVARYIGEVLSPAIVSADLARALHARTEGSPLFVAEVARELARGGGDAAAAASALASDVPRSVLSMVQRKIDRLSDDDRRLLAVASVQGIECDSVVVAAVAGVDVAEVEERLDRLEREFAVVSRLGERTLPDGATAASYRFVHALYQNALHASLVPARRRGLSASVADALVRHGADRDAGMALELATLYEAARDAERAVTHFMLAVDEASRVFAHREVAVLCRRALAQADALPDTPEWITRVMLLHFSLGVASMITDGYAAPEAGRAYATARSLAGRLGASPASFAVLAGLFGFYVVAGDYAEAHGLAAAMMRLGEREAQVPLLVMGHFAVGLVHHVRAEHVAAHERFERAIALYDPAQHATHIALYRLDPGIYALGETVRTLWLLGRADEALARAERTVEMARALRDPRSLAFAMMFATFVRQLRREPGEALVWADRAIALCDEHDIAQERAWVLPVRGWALARLGRTEEGISLLRAGIATYTASGAELSLPYFHLLLADALAGAGRDAEALAACDEGLVVSRRTGDVGYDAELWRLRGECLGRTGDAGAAEDATRCVATALEIARGQGARPFELRAATSLSRRSGAAGHRERLASVLASFGEGLDTPDLVDARHALQAAAGEDANGG